MRAAKNTAMSNDERILTTTKIINQSLTSLGLILVAVPVVFQFVLLSGMLTMLWSVQQESVRARESRNRVSRINDCMMGVLEFSFILVSARKDVDKNYVLKEVDQNQPEGSKLSFLHRFLPSINKFRQSNPECRSLANLTVYPGFSAMRFYY